ncbi:MAG: hypothetical protein ACR2L2_00670 [Acidobacteriota bacterium]
MTAKNGNLEQAMALLIQNQAQFLSHLTETRQRMATSEEEIGKRLGHIEAILLRHERALAELPEAILQKVGFKTDR